MRRNIVLLSCIFALSAGVALAQTQGPPQAMRGTPVSGVVKSVAANELVLTTANGDVTVGVTDHTRVLVRQSAAVSEIQPGAYLGTSNHTGADGVSNTATEVHVMASSGGVNYQMDPEHDPSLMMTNGHVTAVQNTARGTEMDVDYGGAQTRHVIVNQSTSMTRMNDIGVAGLHPGMQVNARVAADAQGHQVASFISVQTPRS